jgi:hypothetical protein
MKHGRTAFLAILFIVIALDATTWELRRTIYFLVRIAMEPAGWGCDEGPVTDRSATNARGDVVTEYEKACTGFGTVVDFSIVLQLRGDEKLATLVTHSDPQYGYPKFRWISDDSLSIDLGDVEWVSRKTDNIDTIHITYAYSKARTRW